MVSDEIIIKALGTLTGEEWFLKGKVPKKKQGEPITITNRKTGKQMTGIWRTMSGNKVFVSTGGEIIVGPDVMKEHAEGKETSSKTKEYGSGPIRVLTQSDDGTYNHQLGEKWMDPKKADLSEFNERQQKVITNHKHKVLVDKDNKAIPIVGSSGLLAVSNMFNDEINNEKFPQGYSKSISEYEDEIVEHTGSKYEVAGVFDKDGNLEIHLEGEKSSVRLPDYDYEGKIFTHNHPASRGFSFDDMKAAIVTGMAEMRAVAPKSIFGKGVFKFSVKKDSLKEVQSNINTIEINFKSRGNEDTLLDELAEGIQDIRDKKVFGISESDMYTVINAMSHVRKFEYAMKSVGLGGAFNVTFESSDGEELMLEWSSLLNMATRMKKE